MNTMKVIIQPDGLTAKEINPLGEDFGDFEGNFELNPLPICFDPREELKELNLRNSRLKDQWQKAENSLRTFEIDEESQVIGVWDSIYRKSDLKRFRCENNTSQSGVIFKTATATEGKIWVDGQSYFNRNEVFKFCPNQKYKAEILPNGKIKIIQ